MTSGDDMRTVGDGIRLLRELRGRQAVTFSEVADHLFDFCDVHPDAASVLHDFAAFLAAVEYIPHDHAADPDRGLPAPAAARSR
ncbi:MAG TPA: DUF6104 family protein [Egibacteraceae bacterium]|nr:DUF6104 family protein [Egibacteraceae bacterium]